MSDDLRAACEQWLREQGLLEYNEYTQEPLNNTDLIDALLRFAQQREAATWREAAALARNHANEWDGITAYAAEQMQLVISHECDEKAQALTP